MQYKHVNPKLHLGLGLLAPTHPQFMMKIPKLVSLMKIMKPLSLVKIANLVKLMSKVKLRSLVSLI